MNRTLNQTVAFAYMEYDLKGRRTSLKTTRDGESWDETRWALDPATGLCLSKTYADNSTVSYTYTPDGLPARTTWPGGRWQEDGYNAKREIVSTERSDGEETTFAYDVYSREIAATNDSAAIEITRDERGRATNVTTTVAGTAHSLAREFDSAGRLARSGDLYYEYDSEGRLAVVSNSIAAVEYQYAADGLDAGYSLTLHNGSVFARSVARDAMRRSLVTGITSSMNNNPVESIAYSYDALGRPTSRNNDAFGYNDRSEVTSASIMGWSPSPSTASYGYDDIGNLQLSSFNAATNAYTANGLNQYTSILCDSVTLCEPTYDTDGNMLSDGVLSFTYDAASRLKTVSSNGVTLVTNFYDAKSRRVKKVTPNATTTFFYDDWNLEEERIAYADNTTSTIRYYWGKDLSGTLQGAGGVGGLLWLTIDGVVYIPCYDNNGNVTRYLSVNGGALARYSYDAFGKLIARAGRRASFFRHRFSTKYFDSETGLYYYGYRFYHPVLMRWLNRDSLGEVESQNLYAFLNNFAMQSIDLLGEARMLTGALIWKEDRWGTHNYDFNHALRILQLVNKLNSMSVYDVKIQDFVTTPIAEIRKEIDDNGENVFIIAHGGLLVNGRQFQEDLYEWKQGDTVSEMIYPYGEGMEGIALVDLGPNLKMSNVFGCFLSKRVRKKRFYYAYRNKTVYESSKDTYSSMYDALYNRLEHYLHPVQRCRTKVSIFEGEIENDIHSESAMTDNVLKRWKGREITLEPDEMPPRRMP